MNFPHEEGYYWAIVDKELMIVKVEENRKVSYYEQWLWRVWITGWECPLDINQVEFLKRVENYEQ